MPDPCIACHGAGGGLGDDGIVGRCPICGAAANTQQRIEILEEAAKLRRWHLDEIKRLCSEQFDLPQMLPVDDRALEQALEEAHVAGLEIDDPLEVARMIDAGEILVLTVSDELED